jgi:hypothetical protein
MLLQFGTYSGVGIKTALGMGAIDIVIEKNNKDAEKRIEIVPILWMSNYLP